LGSLAEILFKFQTEKPLKKKAALLERPITPQPKFRGVIHQLGENGEGSVGESWGNFNFFEMRLFLQWL
jgi:hypothetical protein